MASIPTDRCLGQRHVDHAVIEKLKRRIDLTERAQLLKGVPLARAWIGELMRKIAGRNMMRDAAS